MKCLYAPVLTLPRLEKTWEKTLANTCKIACKSACYVVYSYFFLSFADPLHYCSPSHEIEKWAVLFSNSFLYPLIPRYVWIQIYKVLYECFTNRLLSTWGILSAAFKPNWWLWPFAAAVQKDETCTLPTLPSSRCCLGCNSEETAPNIGILLHPWDWK